MPTTIRQMTTLQAGIARRDSAATRDLRALASLWLQELLTWIERSRQRIFLRELAEEDEHLLRDIGKSKAEALREAAKPFWQP